MSSLILVTSSKNIVYYMVRTEMVWFSAHWASMACTLPTSWWLDISTCFRFSSKSSADQAGAKPCDVSATREGPQARFDATTGTDAARLPGDFTSWTPWIGQASKTCDFYNHKSHVIPQWLFQPLPADPDNRTKRNIRLSSSRCSLLRCFPDIYRSSLKQLQTDGTAKQCSFCGPWGLDN